MSSAGDWLTSFHHGLKQLDTAVDDLANLLPGLRAALPMDTARAHQLIDGAAGQAAALREAVRSLAEENLIPAAEWADRDALVTVADAISRQVSEMREVPRGRLLRLADEIDAGRAAHHRPRQQKALEEAREAASSALRAAAKADRPPEVPDAGASNWLAWWWSQPGETQDALLAAMETSLPGLHSFLEGLAEENWLAGAATPRPAEAPPPAPLQANGPPAAATPPPPPGKPATPAPSTKVFPLPVKMAPPASPPVPKPAAVPVLKPPPVKPAPPPAARPAPPPVVIKPAPPPPPPAPRPAPPPKPAPVAEEPTYPTEPPAHDPDLFDFAAFRERFWIAPGGECLPAPWADRPAFLAALAEGQQVALAEADLLRLYLFSRAGAAPACPPEDVRSLAAIWAHPRDSAAGLDDGRADRLRDAALAGTDGGPGWKLSLLLEAARPTRERPPIDHEEVDLLMQAVPFHDRALGQTVRGLLEAAPMLPDAVPALREAFRQRALENPEVLRGRFARARETLHELAKRNRLGAGGKIQRTHCRDAWDEFMSELWLELEPMFSGLKSSLADWDVRRSRAALDALAGRGHAIADDGGVKFQDRGAYDRCAREILDAARRVNDALDLLHQASGRRPPSGVALPVEPAKALHASEPLDDPLEELCRLALLRLLEPPEEPDDRSDDAPHDPEPLDITPALLADYPELLPLLPAAEPVGEGHAALFHADDISQPTHAAAMLLAPAPSRTHAVSTAELLDRLRLHPDIDVTARAITLFAHSREQGQAHARRVERAEQLRGRLATLNECARALDMLATDITLLRKAIDGAEALIASIQSGGEGVTLAAEWLRRLAAHAAQTRDYQLGVLRRRALEEKDPDKRGAVLKAILDRDYGSIQPLLSGQWQDAPENFRVTKWRWRAESVYGKPDRAARRIKALGDDVAREWHPLTGQVTQADRPMRTTLAKFVLGPYYDAGAENRPHHISISVPGLRKHLNDTKANPCYLPQLGGYDPILIVTPDATLVDATIGDALRKCITEGRQSASQAENGVLTVVLVPQATAKFRREHAAWMREQQNAVFFDEYDMCRLLVTEDDDSSRPPALTGFLEIIFEQLAWKPRDSFPIPDGQNAALEMFVGRTEEARLLATTTTYSRIFSGRKLGKSALLNFIRRTYGGKPLPSGLTLRVVYVPAVGEDSEARIGKAILDKLRDPHEGVGYDPQGLPEGLGLADRLLAVLDRFPLDRPDESLLIILDEADMFVEQQQQEYDKQKERCLSFRIRGQVMSRTDSQNLPRVRVLYSGYRATNTREGAWRGAGSDTLRLGPLPADQAATLVAGPLARLGIDAAEQALAVAHRCGCQPIVLLRFGQCLLDRLAQNYPASARHGAAVKVTAEDVVEVFKDPLVQDEIWEMVLGNFQGNERGFAVFAALVREFNGRSPGAVLVDAEHRVLKQLDEIDPRRAWLGPDDDPYDVLNAQFRDFADRHLLVRKSENDVSGYSLKFPHHLPVLMRRGLDALMKEQLRQARPASALEADRGFLSSAALDGLRELLFHPDPDLPVRAVAVASLWQDAVEAPESPGNIADRLDPDHAAGLLAACDPRLADALTRPVLMVRGVTAEAADLILAGRPAASPPPLLLGGASLLRWALRQNRADGMVEAAGIGRLTPTQLRWWFQRVRGYDFDNTAALAEIERRTAGIPLLVEVVDRELKHAINKAAGSTVTVNEFREALNFFDVDIGPTAALLTGPDPDLALTPRELDLLRMACTVSRENGYDKKVNMAKGFVTGWEYYQEDGRIPALNPSGDDLLALEMVQLLGLLPVNKAGARPLERLAVVEPDDPLWRIVAALRAAP